MADGLTAAGLRRLRAAAERHVGSERVPGLVALVARGGQVHVEALGTLAAGGRPVSRESVFRIASTTKPITGAATLALVAEGLLGLDDPVERLLTQRLFDTPDTPQVHRDIQAAAHAALG